MEYGDEHHDFYADFTMFKLLASYGQTGNSSIEQCFARIMHHPHGIP
jgi:hypothetical protein